MTKTVLILGGYGVFGGRLARRLADDKDLRVIVAGRSLASAEAFVEDTQLIPAQLDVHSSDFADKVAALLPDIVIDAVGPFQNYGRRPYHVAETAIGVRAHYLDLSDDAAFTTGIERLDDAAKKVGVTVLSGVSSVPAISSVVALHLTRDLDDVHSIDSVILPGNRAPRGESVMRSILGQVGRPLQLWEAGQFVERPAWSDLRRYDLKIAGSRPILKRYASVIGAPDLSLFPQVMKSSSVSFRAGLELSVMQYGLWGLHWLPRLKLVRSLSFLQRPLKWIADRLEPFGTDRGGMLVEVTGRNNAKLNVRRRWTLIVGRGDGPNIPGIPTHIMVRKLFRSEVRPGARVCLGAFSVADLIAGFDGLNIETGETQVRIETVFANVLGEDYLQLPAPIRDLHDVLDKRRWQGTASVERGKGVLSKFAGWLAGFPPASDSTPVEVIMTRSSRGEIWVRKFGNKRFRSFLSAGKHREHSVLFERFGWLKFRIALRRDKLGLQFPVTGARVIGVPLPRLLIPLSETREHVDAVGTACFDVRISLPMVGLVAHYQGCLKPAVPDTRSHLL